MSLQELYSKCKKIYDEIEAGETVDLAESITLIMDTIELVDKNSLISKNEELDEIQTSTLKVSIVCDVRLRVMMSLSIICSYTLVPRFVLFPC